MMMSRSWLYMGLVILLLSACGAYRQNVLFKVNQGDYDGLNEMIATTSHGYVMQPFDQVKIVVLTNRGEQLIDPQNTMDANTVVSREEPVYQLDAQGTVNLPILGKLKLAGLSLAQAGELLTEHYGRYYKDPFVTTTYLNKRVVVLGATESKIIPLHNEGMNLLEVLALAGGLQENAKGSNIRLIRGDLSNPQVQVIDLSTIQGMRAANLNVLPNDVIYVEPAQRPFTALRDFTPILGAVTSILALIIALNR